MEQIARNDPEKTDRHLLDRIAQALSGLRFGSVEIVIHDGKVVQIERKEKFRLDNGRYPSLRPIA